MLIKYFYDTYLLLAKEQRCPGKVEPELSVIENKPQGDVISIW